MEYLILECDSVDDGDCGHEQLEAKVSRYLKRGWQPQGGLVAVREERFGKFTAEPCTRFYQAVIFPGEDAPIPD